MITPRGPLELQPGHIHLDDIGVIDPGVFVGECQSPAKGTTDYSQDAGGGTCPSPSAYAYGKAPGPRGNRMSDHWIFNYTPRALPQQPGPSMHLDCRGKPNKIMHTATVVCVILGLDCEGRRHRRSCA